MSQEVKNAAESLRRLIPVKCPPSPRWSQDEQNLWTLAQAYLAEHPADENEPITEEWLRSAGFIWQSTDTYELHSGAFGNDYLRYTKIAFRAGLWYANGLGCADCKTRGDVRRLCSALGIPLRTPLTAADLEHG